MEVAESVTEACVESWVAGADGEVEADPEASLGGGLTGCC